MPGPSRFVLLLASLLATLSASAAEDQVFHREDVLGTSMKLIVRANSASDAGAAESAALAEINRLAGVFSTYDPSSELSRWLARPGTEVDLSSDLLRLLKAADLWRAQTGGAFDPRVAAHSDLWRRCAARGVPPTPTELEAVMDLAGREPWRLRPDSGRAVRLTGGPVSLDAIAKGTILDAASEAAMRAAPGVQGVLLEIGGDLRVRGEGTRLISIADPAADHLGARPRAVIKIGQAGIATSGASERGYRIGADWHSHIIDPATGKPAAEIVSATVVAPTAEDADALATAFNVLPVAESLRLADSLPGVACLLIDARGAVSHNGGWAALAREAEPEAGAQEDSAYEMTIKFTLGKPEAGQRGYRRPYVAVWVEDAEGKPVRTVLLFVSMGGPGPRWVTDLKRWSKNDRERRRTDKKDILYTISKPTRPPGEYEAVWDGKDDRGKPLPPGKYTILLEAVREHGTYQIIRQEVELGTEGFTKKLEGNIEISSATLEYRPKAAP